MSIHERLPLEIFLAVLHLCVRPTQTVTDLVTLQRVCRSWHDIITDASFLWGTINSVEGLPAVRKALQMAKNSPLDLIFDESLSEMDQAQFFKLVGGRVSQWRSLVVESDEWESGLAELRTHKPHRLKRLHVITDSYDLPKEGEMVLFGGGSAAGLKDFALQNVPIQLASLQLSGLKALHLEGILPRSATEIITPIIESPSLEILHLSHLNSAVLFAQPAMDRVANSLIHLPFLTNLCLLALPLPFLNLLLSVLVVPHLRHFNIGWQLDKQPAAQFSAVGIDRLRPTLNSITAGSQAYEVYLSSWSRYEIRVGELTVTFFTRFSMDHLQETFNWVSQLDIGLADLPLHLQLDNFHPDPLVLEWFTLRTNVTELKLTTHRFLGPNLERIIPFLGQRRSPPAPMWLVPQVQVFSTNLVGRYGNHEIVEMIKKRHSAADGQSPKLDRALPKRLREIRLAYGGRELTPPPPNEKLLSQVVRVAEGADVYWEGKKWTATVGAHS
ncbi:hypothetical protein FS837_000694 [Tulasnella sp. UAMH 9824]|nr:hypothetical protein FS837_000694 [Tulasnella sp. UAMH 9824]